MDNEVLPKLLLIDDDPFSRSVLRAMCEECYDVLEAETGEEGLERAIEADIILLDKILPGIDGYETCKRIRMEVQKDIPVILASATLTDDCVDRAYDAGCADYTRKPFRQREVMAKLALHMRSQAQKGVLSELVHQKTAELSSLNQEYWMLLQDVFRLFGAIGEDPTEVMAHIIRVGKGSRILAEEVGLPPETCAWLELASQAHDAGKGKIPTQILYYPGRLEGEAWETMKQHTTLGHQMFLAVEHPVFQMAAEICKMHHECPDGSGYPEGLAGDEIPIHVSITQMIDTFDALLSNRKYKSSWSVDDALAEVRRMCEPHFDRRGVYHESALNADLFPYFLKVVPQLVALRDEHPDPE